MSIQLDISLILPQNVILDQNSPKYSVETLYGISDWLSRCPNKLIWNNTSECSMMYGIEAVIIGNSDISLIIQQQR